MTQLNFLQHQNFQGSLWYCHKFTEFDFRPEVNQGSARDGVGAVLVALSVGVGVGVVRVTRWDPANIGWLTKK